MRAIAEVHSDNEVFQQSARSERDDEILVGVVKRGIGGSAVEGDAVAFGLSRITHLVQQVVQLRSIGFDGNATIAVVGAQSLKSIKT